MQYSQLIAILLNIKASSVLSFSGRCFVIYQLNSRINGANTLYGQTSGTRADNPGYFHWGEKSPPGFDFEHAHFVIVFSKEIDFHALQLISSPIKNINNTRRFLYFHLKELKKQNKPPTFVSGCFFLIYRIWIIQTHN